MIDYRIDGSLLAVVLFAGLSLIAIAALRALHRWLDRPPARSRIVEPSRPGQPPSAPLSKDPQLAAFFRAVDRGYGVDPTSKAKPGAPAAPQPIHERADVKPIREGAEPQPSYIRPDRPPLGQAPRVPDSAAAPRPQPSQPPAQQATDPNLLELCKVWHLLTERDRQELMWLARLKLELDE